jgi:site-specific DNA-cytosine methylase
VRHASIVPLIGGETIGTVRAFDGQAPDYFMSYTPFWANDSHAVNHFGVPYHVLDKGERPSHRVDVIGSVCPCAGLSTMSAGFGDDNQNNRWMLETTKFVLEEQKPAVLWGENAPGFAGNIGKNVREAMRATATENGYTMSVYRTRSLLHGVPQVRERSFYFFWRGDKTPLLEYYDRPYPSIESVIIGARGNTQQEPINPKKPSDDWFYRYALEAIHGGVTHREFMERLAPEDARGLNVMSYIEKKGHTWRQVGDWMRANGNEREAEKCTRRQDKLDAGGNIMRRATVFSKDYIGAFVGHYPTCLVHPVEDRYVTYREAMTIMGLPDDFELLNPKRSYNHICQNVPVQTAQDMATEVRAALLGQRPWIDATYVFQYNHSRRHEVADERTRTVMEFMS